MHQRLANSAGFPLDAGRRPPLPHTGLGSVVQQEYDGWQVEIAHRTVGTTLRRDQYSVTIRRESPRHEEFLTGFSTRSAAWAAAQRRIDLLRHFARRVEHRPHWGNRARPRPNGRGPTLTER